MLRKKAGFSRQITYKERDNGISPHWHYMDDRYKYHAMILIHKKTIWFDSISMFCRVFFQIYIDIYVLGDSVKLERVTGCGPISQMFIVSTHTLFSRVRSPLPVSDQINPI